MLSDEDTRRVEKFLQQPWWFPSDLNVFASPWWHVTGAVLTGSVVGGVSVFPMMLAAHAWMGWHGTAATWPNHLYGDMLIIGIVTTIVMMWYLVWLPHMTYRLPKALRNYGNFRFATDELDRYDIPVYRNMRDIYHDFMHVYTDNERELARPALYALTGAAHRDEKRLAVEQWLETEALLEKRRDLMHKRDKLKPTPVAVQKDIINGQIAELNREIKEIKEATHA